MKQFATLKPILGYKAHNHTTPADSLIDLDPEAPDTLALLESGAIKPHTLRVAEPEPESADMTTGEYSPTMVEQKPKPRKK